MINLELLDELASKLSKVLPPSLKETKEDLKQNFKLILQASFTKMNLVTREEFDKQTALLQKAREKLTVLEAKIEQKKS
jgi:BMFP domain-containing protein YqiC